MILLTLINLLYVSTHRSDLRDDIIVFRLNNSGILHTPTTYRACLISWVLYD